MSVAQPPDDVLVSLSKDGNLDAFNSLVFRYEALVYHLCLRLLGQREAAEDAAQEAFLSAFRSIGSFRGGSFRAWILKVAANACRDEFRRRSRRPRLEAPPGDDGEAFDATSQDRMPEELARDADLRRAIEQGLAGLPLEQREAVVLVDYLGFDYGETATIMGSSLGTVKSRLHRGREGLRRYVLAHPELFGDRWRLGERGR